MLRKKVRMADNLQVWRCPDGHVLGVAQQTGKSMSRLMLYRNAVDTETQDPVQVDIIAVIESAIDIRCDICEKMRTWAPNQAAYERLMARYKPVEKKLGIASAENASQHPHKPQVQV